MHSFLSEVLFTNQDIVKRSEELGQLLTKDYQEKSPLIVGLLKGSVPFMAELIKHLDCDFEIDFMQVSSYEGIKSTLEVKVIKDLDANIEGRHVIIVEDIIDTGLTLQKVLDVLAIRKPASIEIVTLLNKEEGRLITGLTPKYIGFEIPNKFVVGFGLDYNQHYRGIDCIGVLKKEIYTKE